MTAPKKRLRQGGMLWYNTPCDKTDGPLRVE